MKIPDITPDLGHAFLSGLTKDIKAAETRSALKRGQSSMTRFAERFHHERPATSELVSALMHSTTVGLEAGVISPKKAARFLTYSLLMLIERSFDVERMNEEFVVQEEGE